MEWRLHYSVNTKADISYAVDFLIYLKSTWKLELKYAKSSNLSFSVVGYPDADYGQKIPVTTNPTVDSVSH